MLQVSVARVINKAQPTEELFLLQFCSGYLAGALISILSDQMQLIGLACWFLPVSSHSIPQPLPYLLVPAFCLIDNDFLELLGDNNQPNSQVVLSGWILFYVYKWPTIMNVLKLAR